jgi:predicted DNA-binding transcriptional regulator YafY
MGSKNHDTLVYRLAQILVKLNQGERLIPRQLAEEFGVDLRTIQRDLNIRFAYLPLQKTEGQYHLDPVYLGKLTTGNIQRFAAMAGISGLFPSLGKEFLAEIFDDRVQAALLVKGHSYEDLTGKESLFKDIELAIANRRHMDVDFIKNDDIKTYKALSPYKLINKSGIWYLAAIDNSKLKTFSFAKIKHINLLGTKFIWDKSIDELLKNNDDIWMSETTYKVVLKINSEIAHYFKRRKLIANQILESELPDGSLIISAEFGHKNQILPIVRYWIPHIEIISPVDLALELKASIKKYLISTLPIEN